MRVPLGALCLFTTHLAIVLNVLASCPVWEKQLWQQRYSAITRLTQPSQIIAPVLWAGVGCNAPTSLVPTMLWYNPPVRRTVQCALRCCVRSCEWRSHAQPHHSCNVGVFYIFFLLFQSLRLKLTLWLLFSVPPTELLLLCSLTFLCLVKSEPFPASAGTRKKGNKMAKCQRGRCMHKLH